MVNTKIINGVEYKDVSTEIYRVYTFAGGEEIKVQSPLLLNVSASGGHRIIVSEDSTVYIPAGWLKLQWVNKDGAGPVQF